MDLTATLRDLSRQQATGRLVVRFPKTLASIYLVAGDIVHATLGFSKGPEALATILQKVPIRSEFRPNLTAPEVTMQASLESLLAVYAPKPEGTGSELTPPRGQVSGQAEAGQPARAPQPLPDGDVVPTGFIADLTRVLIYIMGPIGTIVLEDAQADLNLGDAVPKSEVQGLVTEITRQLRTPDRQQTFQQEAAVLLARYDLD